MNLWVLFACMSLVAVAFAAWPLYREQRKLTPVLAITIIGIVGLSAWLYLRQGSPQLAAVSGPGMSAESQHVNEDAVAALAERLRNDPNDVGGWIMLGRSYSSLGNVGAANDAFERALEVAPDDPQALFFGGLAAANRNDNALAADRWERLLDLNPPPEIQDTLRQRIREMRGEPTAPTDQGEPEAPPEDTVVSIDLSLSDAARAEITGDANVFVIARDPAAPSPPIAVTRLRLSALPTTVHLGDQQSMVAGRNLSAFAEFEIVARVSLSGQPGQQSGDWYGSMIVNPAEQNTVAMAISEQVP